MPRRWLGMLVDWVAFGVVSWGLIAVVIGVFALSARHAQAPPLWIQIVAQVVAGVLVFGLPALRAGGGSFGQTMVWLTPSWPQGASTSRRLARAGITGGVYTLGQIGSTIANGAGGPWGALDWVCTLWIAGCVVAVPFTGRARGLSARLTGAEMLDVRAQGVRTGAVTST